MLVNSYIPISSDESEYIRQYNYRRYRILNNYNNQNNNEQSNIQTLETIPRQQCDMLCNICCIIFTIIVLAISFLLMRLMYIHNFSIQ
jgi:hypothetical protein